MAKPAHKQDSPSTTGTLARGFKFYRERKFREAEYCFQLVLREFPYNPQALNFLGILAVEAKRLDEAIRLIALAAKHAPKDASIRNNLGNVYLLNGNLEKAARVFRNALELDPMLIQAHLSLAKAYRKMGKGKDAEATFKRALMLFPENKDALLGLSETLVETGSIAEAELYFRSILLMEPQNSRALLGYAVTHKFKPSDPEISAIEALLEHTDDNSSNSVTLHHAAGKMFHDLKRHDEAFSQFKRSKEVLHVEYDIVAYRDFVGRMKGLFDKTFFASRMGFGYRLETPVFIVGMPRSGTTLAEQILASHPSVWGAGERTDFTDALNELQFDSLRSPNFPQSIRDVSAKKIGDVAKRYLETMRRSTGGSTSIVNKLPHNFEYLGLIALAFPAAKIIHCTREPLDNCLSCYMQSFNQSHAYNRDLETLGRYYREYHGLMKHWSENLPIPIFELSYEALIAEQEKTSRSLIDFIGLPWNDDCLAFHNADRSVSTPSRWQVRQPIYKSSIQVWRSYENHLGPLISALGDLAGQDQRDEAQG